MFRANKFYTTSTAVSSLKSPLRLWGYIRSGQNLWNIARVVYTDIVHLASFHIAVQGLQHTSFTRSIQPLFPRVKQNPSLKLSLYYGKNKDELC